MKSLFLYLHISFLFSLEYAIIYEENLYDAASSIANLYSNEVQDDFKLNTEIFSKNHIETFSGNSMEDKIKTFIVTLKEQNQDLDYILILGDENSFPPIYTNSGIPSDDFFTTSSDNLNLPPAISIGRIPSSDSNEINIFVEKLTTFLLSPTVGSWRNKAILIADDENKSGENEACEINHTKNSDIIYDILSSSMDIKTFYGVEYEPVMTSDGLEHTQLNQDIINEINDGFALINYIGHGDQRKLSAEKIIKIEDLPQISENDNKFGLWVVGTCKFGQYDNELCMAEELISNENAAIGVISTVRAISSTYNTNFLTYLFSEYANHFNSSEIIRIGDIIKNSKNTSYDNNSFYQGYVFHLFGDPALPIFSSKQNLNYNFPEDIALIEQNIIENDSGYDLGSVIVSFNEQETDVLEYGTPTNFCDGQLSYTKPGDIIFKDNFTESSCFNIPLDAINCTNCDLKIRLNYQNDLSYNGTFALSENINLITEIEEIGLLDNEGPLISFNHENFILNNNSILPANSAIEVSLEDPSGINIFEGIGHNMRYWFNNNIESYNIPIDSFNYSNACSGAGQTNINLSDNQLGNQKIFFEVWDNLNNRTVDSISLYIGEKKYQNHVIDNFINIPNPFRDITYFTYHVPDVSHLPINLDITVLSLNGDLIKNIKTNGNNPFNSILWDGKDSKNNPVPNGSYLIKVQALSSMGIKQEQIHIVSKID